MKQAAISGKRQVEFVDMQDPCGKCALCMAGDYVYCEDNATSAGELRLWANAVTS